MIAVTPIPPAVQTEINPRPEPFSCSSFAIVATIRAPVAANGCPIAMLPPLVLSRSRLMRPIGSFLPRLLRQKSSDCHALSVASVCAAKA